MRSLAADPEAGEDGEVEAVPLTAHANRQALSPDDADEPTSEAFPTIRAAGRPLANMALPVLFTYLCNFVLPVTSVRYVSFILLYFNVFMRLRVRVCRVQVIAVGHNGDATSLAAIGLAVFFCNVTGTLQ